ncbi:secreted RxLR effector protein 161-like [Malus domestica]|uniref:secreted RxLR effector protein 161-like n=1 Tax=Malus domestica TaxID=3750 RepID=UPI0039763CA3
MERPTELHLKATKRVLRYLKGTVNFGLFYKKGGREELLEYNDSDYAGDLDDRKRTSGYVFMLSLRAISWSSKKQPVVTLSTTEAEFVAAASIMHGRSKHIDIRFHFLRELTKDEVVGLVHCSSQEQVAYIMTKPLKLDVFQKLRGLLGVQSFMDIN